MKSIMTSVFSTTERIDHHKNIESLSELISAIKEIKQNSTLIKDDDKMLFRGHSDIAYDLIPSLWRPNNKGQYYNESQLIDQFLIEEPSARERHKSNLELLSYAQHYGLPTRLLDWTTNILVAAFFACQKNLKHEPNNKSNTEIESDANIFCLEKSNRNNLNSLNNNYIKNEIISSHDQPSLFKKLIIASEKSGQNFNALINDEYIPLNNIKFETLLDLVKVITDTKKIQITTKGFDIPGLSEFDIYIPPKINARLKAQHGCFTVHMGKIVGRKMINFEYNQLPQSRIVKLTIPSHSKKMILDELNLCGINKQTLFPELEYQTEAIKQRCFDD